MSVALGGLNESRGLLLARVGNTGDPPRLALSSPDPTLFGILPSDMVCSGGAPVRTNGDLNAALPGRLLVAPNALNPGVNDDELGVAAADAAAAGAASGGSLLGDRCVANAATGPDADASFHKDMALVMD